MKKQELPFRFNVFAACVAGCLIGNLLAVLLLVKTDVAALAFIVSVMLPPAFCFFAGVRQLKYLFTIAAYAVIGWLIGSMLTPVVSMSPSAQLTKIINSPLVGHDGILPCIVLSAILVIGRAIFVKRAQPQANTNNGIAG